MILTSLKKGFTLVELMVVLSIIGLLAAAFYPSLTGYLARGRDSNRLTEIKQINNALVQHQVANRTYKMAIFSGSGQGWVNAINSGESISILKALETKGFLRNGIQDILAADMSITPVILNTAPCATNTTYSRDLYMLYFSDTLGKYSISAHMENQLQPNMDNMMLSYNSGASCGVYGRNYSLGIN